MSYRNNQLAGFVLIFSLFCTLCQITPAQQPAISSDSSMREKIRIERLSGLARVWGTVKFFHPYPAYQEIDWDKALVETIPKVNAAKTPEEYLSAVNYMLSFLHDKNTFAEIKTENKKNNNEIKKEPFRIEDDVLVIDAIRFEEIDQNKIIQAISEAKMIVIDLRDSEFPKSNDIDYFQAVMEGLFSRIMETDLNTASLRHRIHEGYAPYVLNSTEDIYYSGIITNAPKQIKGLGKNPMPPVALITNEKTPPITELLGGLASLKQVRIVQEGEREPSIKTYPMELPDGITARIRTVELLNHDGSLGLHADTVMERNSSADIAIKEAIKIVKENKPKQILTRQPVVYKPINLKEKPYAEMEYPNTEYRLLALFRFWNIINIFYSYKKLIDEPWEDVLPRYIPKFEADQDAADYQGTALEMVAEIQDSHGSINSGNAKFTERLGRFLPPLRVRYVEDKPMVIYSYDEKADVKIGDSILKIDGIPFEQYGQKLSVYIPASTPQALKRNMGNRLLLGQKDSRLKLTLLGTDGKTREAEVSRTMSAQDPRWADSAPVKRSTPVFSVLPSGFGYADINRLQEQEFDQMMETIKNTPAVIFDMRGYPRMDNSRLALNLTDRNEVSGQSSITIRKAIDLTKDWLSAPNYSYKGLLGKPFGKVYKGKVVIIINEYAQSASEAFCMYMKAAADVTFIGTPTAGANGDVTNTVLPGNLIVAFTGMEIRLADGRQLQRVGIQPDIKIAPTIRGIAGGRDEVLEAGIKYLQENIKK